jgi:hypothetical protein
MAEYRDNLTPYNYVQNNPIIRIDATGMLDDIVIKGDNNSSITVKTDIVNITVDGSSILGDLGGNYTIGGRDVLIASLDLAGIIDPTGIADAAAAYLEAQDGNWGGAFLSGLGTIPYLGDLGKIGKVADHVKTIDKAIDAAKAADKTKDATKTAGKLEKSKTGPGTVPKSERDPKRVPSAKEKKDQLNQQDGKCANCDKKTTDKDSRSHHYPERHADGGKETVQVCKDCHKELHSGG